MDVPIVDIEHDTSEAAASDLRRLVGVEMLHRLQDAFSALGKVTVCVCTRDGELITPPTWGSRFSELVGTAATSRKGFAAGVRACAQNPNKDAPPPCHEGMAFYAARIVHESRHLGTIVVGTRMPELPPEDELRALATRCGVDPEELLESTSQIDPYLGGEPEAIHRFADVFAAIVATVYRQADRIRRQLMDLHTVHELTGLLSGTRDLQEILDQTVKRVVDVMPVKACGIRLLNPATGELVVKAVHNLSEEYLLKGPILLEQNSIDARAFAGETVYIEDAANDPRIRYPEKARREGIVSGLCVPMTYRGRTVGVLRVYASRRHRFDLEEESLLRSIGSQTAAALMISRLYEDQAKAERSRRQLTAAAEIQRRMIPAQAPLQPGLTFGCVFDPTLDLGGDFYDFIRLHDGQLGMAIADVVGKGLPAALLMSSVRSTLRCHAEETKDVGAVVSDVNQHVCRDTLAGEFVTLMYGVFSSDGRQFTYCNAGHEPPLLLRDDRFTRLDSGGMVVGVDPQADYQYAVVDLKAGDVLVLVTDGVCEALDFEDRAYGRDRLHASIRKHQSLNAQELATQLLWDVRRFAGLADQSDDITVSVVKVE